MHALYDCKWAKGITLNDGMLCGCVSTLQTIDAVADKYTFIKCQWIPLRVSMVCLATRYYSYELFKCI